MKPLRVGILGATGLVGRELVDCLAASRLEVAELRLFASERSAGAAIEFAGAAIAVEAYLPARLEGLDWLFIATGADLARQVVPVARAEGVRVIDNSSAHRLDADVPLVVPEVNGAALDPEAGLVANPNCSTIIVLTSLSGLVDAFGGLGELIVSTYQAVSGAGRAGLEELQGSKRDAEGESSVFPAPIGLNLIPSIGAIVADGETAEERKMREESRKILERPRLDVSCTCVRVPTARAHAFSILARFDGPVDLEEARCLLEESPGLRLIPDDRAGAELNPLAAEARNEVLVGRLRRVGERGLALFVVGDQLRRGAALNALRIAERLAEEVERRDQRGNEGSEPG